MTQNAFVSFSSTVLPVRGYWVERPSVFCWSAFTVLLLYACLFKDNVWLFLDDKIPRARHPLWQEESVQPQGWMFDKIMGVAIELTANPSLPKGCLFPELLHPRAFQFATSPTCVCISHYLFNLLRDSRVLLQYSNPLHMQTKKWMVSLVLILKKMHHEVTLSSLMETTRWGLPCAVHWSTSPSPGSIFLKYKNIIINKC